MNKSKIKAWERKQEKARQRARHEACVRRYLTALSAELNKATWPQRWLIGGGR